MKLKLTKQWYEERTKAEAKCADIAAAVSGSLIVAEGRAGTVYRTNRSSRQSASKKISASKRAKGK